MVFSANSTFIRSRERLRGGIKSSSRHFASNRYETGFTNAPRF